MKRFHLLLLSLFSGLLLSLAWPMNGFPGLLFVALVPLLVIEDHFWNRKNSRSAFALIGYVLPAFLIWNLLTTWWIVNSTLVGALVAIVLNSVFMTIIFVLFHLSRRTLTRPAQGYLALIFYWITFEFIHHHWDLNWPWLSLGNGFAAYHKWIQWYEFTGIFGGTLWVLIMNILVFFMIKAAQNKEHTKNLFFRGVIIALVIITPIITSVCIYKSWETDKGQPVDVVVVQPNLDPYSEQYELPPLEVVDRIWNIATQKTDELTQFVVCPESAIQEYVWEEHMNYTPSVIRFREYLQDFPNAALIVGLSTRRMFEPGEELTPSARKFSDADMFYDAYNTAMILDTSQQYQLYHKSKLTPGVEVMPLVRYFKFIEKLAFNLGGTVGSLGTDAERIPFTNSEGLKVGTAVCYESVYGDFMAGYVRNGANLIFVITNDGWWGNTPGHRQHLLFSSIRAIEMRRSIARSANTGISCFVNKRGDIQQATKYWEPGVIQQEIYTGEKMTFYVIYGDYIARISAFGTVLMLLITLMLRLKNTGRGKTRLK
ncbi:MAG: apolipoprotein N-acyltransferase [Bacteroidales bacterium]|nr:apolipoprotein N-acyltransferase [Bacteroidales bacterium]MDZ4205049.1 apolipoprotein N-acyltransferase [Bacteroidales bacterium]